MDDCTLFGRCTNTSVRPFNAGNGTGLVSGSAPPLPTAERFLRRREHRIGRDVADDDQHRVVGAVVGLMEIDDRLAIDRRQACPASRRCARRDGSPNSVWRNSLLFTYCGDAVCACSRCAVVRLHQIELGLREARVADDVGEDRQHLRQRGVEAAHLERRHVLAGSAAQSSRQGQIPRA